VKNNIANRIFVMSLAALATASPSLVLATNGLYQHGYGSRQNGIAGGGVAFPQDPLIASINPAGVVYVGRKNEIDLVWFSPRREYTVNASPASGNFPPFPGPTVKSGSESFFIPSLGFSWPIGDNDDKAVGFALYGNGGMNTDYDAADTPFGVGSFGGGAVPGGGADSGVDYTQLFANLNYSQKFADGKASWGIAGILNYSRLEMRGFSAFGPFSLDPANLSDKGHDNDTGFGLRLGIQGDVGSGVTLAASYQTEINNKFDDYAGLFPDGGKLNIPASLQVGLAAKAGPGTITADIQHVFYSDAKGVGDPGTTGLPTGCIPSAPFTASPVASGPSCLGNDPGIGFGWEDMTVLKLGYTWSTGNDWTWRVGASYGKQPIPSEDVTFNIIAPGVIETHLTVGFSKALGKGRAFSMALTYAPEKCVNGPDLFTPGQTVELCMHQVAVNAGFSF
jgi:long-chain fatty acid transport protein